MRYTITTIMFINISHLPRDYRNNCNRYFKMHSMSTSSAFAKWSKVNRKQTKIKMFAIEWNRTGSLSPLITFRQDD